MSQVNFIWWRVVLILTSGLVMYHCVTEKAFDTANWQTSASVLCFPVLGVQRYGMVRAVVRMLLYSIDTKAICLYLKKLTCLCGRCLPEFIDWRYSQSTWYFRPSFVNCYSSNPFSNSTLPPPPCVRGGGLVWSSGSQTDKHLPQSPLTGQYFRHFALPSMSLIFPRCMVWINVPHNGLHTNIF